MNIDQHDSQRRESLMAEVFHADRLVKAAHYIPGEDVKAWLLSWGMKEELPPPKCICGAECKFTSIAAF